MIQQKGYSEDENIDKDDPDNPVRKQAYQSIEPEHGWPIRDPARPDQRSSRERAVAKMIIQKQLKSRLVSDKGRRPQIEEPAAIQEADREHEPVWVSEPRSLREGRWHGSTSTSDQPN
jgi:hypothetical protein